MRVEGPVRVRVKDKYKSLIQTDKGLDRSLTYCSRYYISSDLDDFII